MTREKLVDILVTCEIDNVVGCADRILAALEAERVVEVVIFEGEYGSNDSMENLLGIIGKKGSLIFRPEVER